MLRYEFFISFNLPKHFLGVSNLYRAFVDYNAVRVKKQYSKFHLVLFSIRIYDCLQEISTANRHKFQTVICRNFVPRTSISYNIQFCHFSETGFTGHPLIILAKFAIFSAEVLFFSTNYYNYL